jgi:hypothetical protein
MMTFCTRVISVVSAAMVVCALGVSTASAASWGVVNSEHTLNGPSLTYTLDGTPPSSLTCEQTQCTADVSNASQLKITSSEFNNCTGTIAGSHCTVTMTGTRFPWVATGTTTHDIEIHGVHIAIKLENIPGGAACTGNGISLTATGTLKEGVWDAVTHRITLAGAPGLTSHSVLGSTTLTVTGALTDVAQTLTLG